MAEVGSLRVKFSLDDSGFAHSLTTINRNLRGLKSEMGIAKAGGTDFGKSLEGLNMKSDILNRTFNTQKMRVEELKRQYDESVRVKGADAKETENLAIRYNQASAELERTEQELKAVTEEIRRQTDPWLKLGTTLKDTGEKLKNVGEGMKNVGRELSTKVTAPLVAFGGLTTKLAIDFESAFAGVRKTVDATETQFDELKMGIRTMAKEIPVSANEIARVGEAAGQLGIETENILGFSRVMVDLGVATDMSSDQAAMALARLANITNMAQTDFDRLGATIVDLGNNFAATEGEISEMALRIAGAGSQIKMSEADILGFAAALASVGIRAEAGGTAISKLMIEMASDVEMGGDRLQEFARVAGLSVSDFKKAFKEDAASAIFTFLGGLGDLSEQGESAFKIIDDLGLSEIRLRDTILRSSNARELANGALKTANEAWEENVALTNEANERYNTTESKLIIFRNKLTDVGITLGNSLIPALTSTLEVMEPLIVKVDGLANKFSEMDPKTQRMVIGLGVAAAATGPVIFTLGALTTTIGGIVTVAGSVATAISGAGGLVAAISLIAAPVAIAVAAVAALAAIGYTAYRGIKYATSDSIDEINLFSDEVSESTQIAVGAFMDLNEKATLSLNTLNWSAQGITNEMKESLVENFQDMSNQIVESLKEKQGEAIATFQELFVHANKITIAEKEAILENVNKGFEERIEATERGAANINFILESAAKENRKLTEFENAQLERIQQEMVDMAIQTLTENEREQKVILERMHLQASEISARQAADVVKNSVEQKNKVVAEAEEQFNLTLAEIIRQRDELGAITDEQAVLMINAAIRQKDGTVKQAEEMHEKIVEQAKLQAGEHIYQVDWQTGEILSKWDMFTRNMVKKTAEMSVDGIRKFKDLKLGVESTVEAMKTYATKKFSELTIDAGKKFLETKEKIVTPIKDAATDVLKWIGEVKSFFDNLKLKIPKPELPSLPKFSLSTNTTNIMGKGITYPTGFNIKWNARGAYFDKPVVFNSPYGLQGFGEAGGEIAMPAEGRHMHPFADAVFDRLASHFQKSNTPQDQQNGNVTNIYVSGNIDKDLYDEIMENQAKDTNKAMFLQGMREVRV